VFLDVGVKLGVPAAPLAFLLLFASNFFSVITPQDPARTCCSQAAATCHRGPLQLGAIATAVSLVVYLVIGTPWLLLSRADGTMVGLAGARVMVMQTRFHTTRARVAADGPVFAIAPIAPLVEAQAPAKTPAAPQAAQARRQNGRWLTAAGHAGT